MHHVYPPNEGFFCRAFTWIIEARENAAAEQFMRDKGERVDHFPSTRTTASFVLIPHLPREAVAREFRRARNPSITVSQSGWITGDRGRRLIVGVIQQTIMELVINRQAGQVSCHYQTRLFGYCGRWNWPVIRRGTE